MTDANGPAPEAGNIVAVDGTVLPDATIATDIDFKNALTTINAELQTIAEFGAGDAGGRWSCSVLAGLVHTCMEVSYDLTNSPPVELPGAPMIDQPALFVSTDPEPPVATGVEFAFVTRYAPNYHQGRNSVPSYVSR